MKKIFILFVFFVSAFLACKNYSDRNNIANVSGFISGFQHGKLVIYKYTDFKLVPVDSTTVEKYKFEIKIKNISQPEMFYFFFGQNQAVIECFAEPGNIQIIADIKKPENLRITGSKTQNDYSSFLENNIEFENKLKKIFEQKQKALTKGDFIMHDILDSSYKAVVNEQLSYAVKYVTADNENIVAAFITARSLSDNIDIEQIKKIAKNFSPNVKKSVYYSEISEKIKIAEMLAPGKQAPDFSASDFSGDNVSLSSMQGKYVLLEFSASWQQQSVDRNYFLNNIYSEYSKYGFEIFTFSIETHKQSWINTSKANMIKHVTVSDLNGTDSEILKLYGVNKIPSNYLLDKKGIIIEKNIDDKKILDFLNKLSEKK